MKPHFIEKDHIIVAFFPDTLRFYEINEFTRNIMRDIMDDLGEKEILKKYCCSKESYESMKNVMYLNSKGAYAKRKSQDNVLKKLVINITNVCNLSCKYCYANGGNYNSQECMMSKDTIIKALDVFYGHYKNIECIQIFGGEPTLNPRGIETIGEYVERKFLEDEEHKTKLGMVSNGTIINDDLISLIKKYNIHVTVSLDGPVEVNDEMRILKNGKGTGKIVEGNVLRLKKFTGEPSSIEATYNKRHEELGIKIKDIISYGKNTFGIDSFHITPVSAEEQDDFALMDRREFIDSVHELMGDNHENMPINDMINGIIRVLRKKHICQYLCEAGLSVMSVSVKGDVYPCFMLIDQQSYNMGNIYDPCLFQSKKFNKIKKELFDYSKFEDVRCKECFNNSICHGCIGSNYFETGNIFQQSDVSCQMYRSITEQVILELVRKNRND